MTEASERIWPDRLFCHHPDDKTFGARMEGERREYVRADPFPALGAAAMLRKCKAMVRAYMNDVWAEKGLPDRAADLPACLDTLTPPTHADLRAEALKLTEVAAMADALRWYAKGEPDAPGGWLARRALAALDARHE